MKIVDNPSKSSAAWYETDTNNYDEMWDANQQPRSHWQYFSDALQSLGINELTRRSHDAHRLLRENGVTYNIYSDPSGFNRPWELDPIPLLISSEEWFRIEQGLSQRAELLNLVLKDLYGPRDLIKKGLLPLELIYSHNGFLRPCDQIQQRGLHQLLIHAVDLTRGPNGDMWVLGDRVQAPSGAGYALENRMAMTRIMPSLFRDCHVHRLAMFFQALRSSLAELSPHDNYDPNIVVLTPGPRNETYFEHAYLASYLGYTLVQGDDLTVRDDRVWMKSLEGLHPVDIILRRVDDDFCDPLELREDSHLGVAGLLEVVRSGNVVVANPIGSSILENPALLAFLPKICQHYFGQELQLPSVATWWCGYEKERDYVLQNLDTLVVKPIYRHVASPPIFGSQLSKKELANLRVRILSNPNIYVGQEQIGFSTIPSLVDKHLEPRNMVLRTYLVARQDSYAVMPGGLTRVAAKRGDIEVSNQAGGVSKDTWVIASEPEKQVSLWVQPAADQITVARAGTVPSRMADNLFWVGRYRERAGVTTRLLRIILQKANEINALGKDSESEIIRILIYTLQHLTVAIVDPSENEKVLEDQDLLQEIPLIVLDTNRDGSLTSILDSFIHAAYGVRDRWSTDTWRVIDDIDEQWTYGIKLKKVGLTKIQSMLDQLTTTLVAFDGLAMESMTREQGWRFLEIGKRLERSLMMISVIRSMLTRASNPVVYQYLLEAVLVCHESIITYRRRYRSNLQLATVLELLLFDEANPRSLIYQFENLQRNIDAVPRIVPDQKLSSEQRAILEASTQLRLTDVVTLSQTDEKGTYSTLDQLLSRFVYLLQQISNDLTETYFRQTQSPQQLVITKPGSELDT